MSARSPGRGELPRLTPRRFALSVSAASGLLAVALFAGPLVGSTRVDLSRAFDFSIPRTVNPDANIVFVVRLPRTLLAAVVGAALAASGLTLQSLLRNPLASPFTLGISGGAALASAITIRLGIEARWGGFPSLMVAALAGSAAASALVYLLGRSRGYLSPGTLLLAGVTLHFFFSALILLLQYTADFTQSYQMVRWVMGGLDVIELGRVGVVAALVSAALLLLLVLARDFNVLALGEETALSLGVSVERTRRLAFAAASLATGSAISAAGPILFVGLMVPHLLRLILGPDHRLLMPCSILGGGAFLVFCDTAARTLLAPTEIPVGVVTALLGGPFFLWLLLREKLRGVYDAQSSL